jgi:hypothetical protein
MLPQFQLHMCSETKKYQFWPKIAKFSNFVVLRKQAKITFSIKHPRKSTRYRVRKIIFQQFFLKATKKAKKIYQITFFGIFWWWTSKSQKVVELKLFVMM